MSSCPCCSYPLLRHIRHSQVDLFCQHCWQFMPDFSTPLTTSHSLSQFHNQVDLMTTQPGWNREPNHYPHQVNVSDPIRFKNAKPTPEKTRRSTVEKSQRLVPQTSQLLISSRES